MSWQLQPARVVDLVELAREEVTFDDNSLFLNQLRGYGHPRLLQGHLLSQHLLRPWIFGRRRYLLQKASSPELYSDGTLHLLTATRVHHSQSSAGSWGEVRRVLSLLDFWGRETGHPPVPWGVLHNSDLHNSDLHNLELHNLWSAFSLQGQSWGLGWGHPRPSPNSSWLSGNQMPPGWPQSLLWVLALYPENL